MKIDCSIASKIGLSENKRLYNTMRTDLFDLYISVHMPLKSVKEQEGHLHVLSMLQESMQGENVNLG